MWTRNTWTHTSFQDKCSWFFSIYYQSENMLNAPSERQSNHGKMSCSRTQVHQPGLEPILCCSYTPDGFMRGGGGGVFIYHVWLLLRPCCGCHLYRLPCCTTRSASGHVWRLLIPLMIWPRRAKTKVMNIHEFMYVQDSSIHVFTVNAPSHILHNHYPNKQICILTYECYLCHENESFRFASGHFWNDVRLFFIFHYSLFCTRRCAIWLELDTNLPILHSAN